MIQFARLDDTNKVIKVHVLNNAVITDEDGNEQEQLGIDFLSNLYGGDSWKQTSQTGSFRKNYASVGFTYDVAKDAFISPKPFDSWTLIEDTCMWDAPTPMPDDDKRYTWNENTTTWDLISDGWKE